MSVIVRILLSSEQYDCPAVSIHANLELAKKARIPKDMYIWDYVEVDEENMTVRQAPELYEE